MRPRTFGEWTALYLSVREGFVDGWLEEEPSTNETTNARMDGVYSSVREGFVDGWLVEETVHE